MSDFQSIPNDELRQRARVRFDAFMLSNESISLEEICCEGFHDDSPAEENNRHILVFYGDHVVTSRSMILHLTRCIEGTLAATFSEDDS